MKKIISQLSLALLMTLTVACDKKEEKAQEPAKTEVEKNLKL